MRGTTVAHQLFAAGQQPCLCVGAREVCPSSASITLRFLYITDVQPKNQKRLRTSFLPQGSQASVGTCEVCPSSVLIRLRFSTSQMRTLLSAEPVANTLPSGLGCRSVHVYMCVCARVRV
eukprot:1160203-Pelagomonas_calceolata.AAC.8